MEELLKTTYLIDSENVNDAWINVAGAAGEGDSVLVFYTSKSPHMSYENVIEVTKIISDKVEWIKCAEGTNALDFQLVTELGFRIAKNPDRTYVIVSNDQGFDAVVKYWTSRELTVSRIRSADCKKLVKKENEAANKVEKEVVEEVAEVKTEEKKPAKKKKTKKAAEITTAVSEVDAAEEVTATENNESVKENQKVSLSDYEADIEALSKTISIEKLTLYHDVFVGLYTQKTGDEIYHAMKKDKQGLISKYSKNFNARTKDKTRIKSFIEFICEKAGISKTVAGKIATIYNKEEKPKENLSKLNLEFTKAFGMEKGNEYYKILKKHVKTMCKF